MAIASIDYSSIRFDLEKISQSRMLSQFYNSKILKLLLNAFTEEVQELSTAISDLISKRSLANAEGEQLDVIGRIVGQQRTGYTYVNGYWFSPDGVDVCPDNGHWWMQNQPQSVEQDMDDITYRKWLWLKILENHNLFSSVPEIKTKVVEGIGEEIGIETEGTMIAKIYVSSNISLTNKELLRYYRNTKLTDNDYMFSYPATTNIDQIVEV